MRILVTAGPTREHLDSVRFISNASSGRMGYGVAVEAALRGHQVVLVSGPVEQPAPEEAGITLIRVESAEEMFDAAVVAFEGCEAAVMTAAVCDYRPATRHRTKLKKSGQTLHLELEPTPDILAHLGEIKGNRFLVGFAMEDHDHRRHAEEKLRRKRCDAIVLNSVATAGSKAGTIELLVAGDDWAPPISGSKRDLAAAVIDLVESLARGR